CREGLLKQLLILKRIMSLSEWHRSAVEPCIYHRLDTLHFTSILALQYQVIDVRLMQVELTGINFVKICRLLFQFLYAADRLVMRGSFVVRPVPYWQG